MARSTAPPHSPPRPRPWPKRHRARSSGAANADGGIRRQEADGHRRDPHRQQRRDQRGLAADAVAEMPEERGSHRPGEEGDPEGRQRREGRRSRVGGRERTAGERRCTAAVA